MTQGAALPGPLAALQEGDLIGRDGSHVALRSIGRKKLVAVYFGAGWCPPCRQFSPILSGIAHRTAEDLAVIFVSADRSEREMQAFVGKAFCIRVLQLGSSASDHGGDGCEHVSFPDYPRRTDREGAHPMGTDDAASAW